MKFNTASFLAIALCLVSTSAFAAEEETDTNDKSIVVTATRYLEDVSKAPAAVTIVTAQEIENRNVSRVSDALLQTPSCLVPAFDGLGLG